MSNAFTNFLGGAAGAFLGDGQPNLKDFQHADRLYVRDTYARAPKHGFLYFVSFNINPQIRALDPQWAKNGPSTVGLLVKKIDLPKFQVHTETLNQYNRKTVVQTNIKYSPISVDFHDDNSDLTTGLWTTYYKYYYGDGNNKTTTSKTATGQTEGGISGFLGGLLKGKNGPNTTVDVPGSFKDTKYRSGDINYNYGLNNGQSVPFFTTVDIYVLHQHRFTQYTLVNPMITEWSHDSLDQDAGNKVLANKMQLAYESVIYNGGKIKKGSSAGAFVAGYYDSSPSPLSIGGKGSKSLLGAGGLLGGASDIFEDVEDGNFLGAVLKTKTLVDNAKQLTKAGIQGELKGLAVGALGNIAANANQGLGGIGNSAFQGLFGGVGNTNIASLTQTALSKITGK